MMTAGFIIKDASWVRQAFLVTSDNLQPIDVQNRIFSSAIFKYVDTTPGGNLSINPPPQFTRTADIRVPSKFTGTGGTGSSGMGRYYSEAFDDTSQRIYMRFGVPQFNSLTTFFTGFYSSSAGQIARTGRAGGIFYSIGMLAGFIVSIISWKVVAVHLLGLAIRFISKSPSSKFYYLKPTMPVYWSTVTTIVNQLAVNRGIVPRIGGDDQQRFNNQYKFDGDAIDQLHALLPDIFREGGGIDVYAMANRAQRLARKRYKALETELNKTGDLDITAAVQKVLSDPISDDRPNYNDYIKAWTGVPGAQPKADASAKTKPANSNNANSTLDQTAAAAGGNPSTPPITNPSGEGSETMPKSEAEANDGFKEFFMAELDDGSAFACFRVNATGHVSESFSNSVTESELAQKINGMSSQSRSTNFSFAGGNIDDGIIGKAVGAVGSAIKDVVAGIGEGLHMSGLASLAGSAFVDIPKHWQSSVASLPRASYTINLVSPYGNPISQLLNLDIPLAMLLAAALPLSTGKQSYTSPFILELYDQGRCQTRLGMIDSLSITRGTANLGFNMDGHAMAIDISFSIVDMSSIMTVPVSEGFSHGPVTVGGVLGGIAGAVAGGSVAGVAGAVVGGSVGAAGGTVAGAAASSITGLVSNLGGVFDDDNAFTDYMSVLAGMDLQDQIYQFRRLKLNLTRKMLDWKSWNSASNYAGMVGDILPSRLLSAIYKGHGRGLLGG